VEAKEEFCPMYIDFHSAAVPARKRVLDAGREVVLSVIDSRGFF